NPMVGRQVAGQLEWRLCGLWRAAIAARITANLAAIPAAVALFLLPTASPAQVQSLVAPQSVTAPAAGPVTGSTGSPGATIVAPTPVAPMPAAPPATSPLAQAAPAVPAGQVLLAVAARYGQNAAPITAGLIWRIYAAKPDSPGNFRLIKEYRGTAPTFTLPPGNYVVH